LEFGKVERACLLGYALALPLSGAEGHPCITTICRISPHFQYREVWICIEVAALEYRVIAYGEFGQGE
jgi:hypothetical protein